MHKSVRDVFLDFNRDMEGRIAHLYLDTKGLPTIAVGYQVMSLAEALTLPFLVDGRPATPDEIRTEFAKIVALSPEQVARHKDKRAWGAAYFAGVTRLRMDDAGMDDICLRRFDLNEKIIARMMPRWANWPADAKLALHSMCWAAGAGGIFNGYPNFMGFARMDPPNFYGCATESDLSEEQDSNIKKRNARQRILFRNAAVVRANGWDASVLHFPEEISSLKERKFLGWEPKFKLTAA